jgi:hypothetical protein
MIEIVKVGDKIYFAANGVVCPSLERARELLEK